MQLHLRYMARLITGVIACDATVCASKKEWCVEVAHLPNLFYTDCCGIPKTRHFDKISGDERLGRKMSIWFNPESKINLTIFFQSDNDYTITQNLRDHQIANLHLDHKTAPSHSKNC